MCTSTGSIPTPVAPYRSTNSIQVSGVPATRIEDLRAGRQIAARNVIERARPARLEALIESVVDTPRLLAVDA